MRIFYSSFLVFSVIILVKQHGHTQPIIDVLPRWMVSLHTDVMYPRKPIKEFLDDTQWGYRVEAQYRLQYNKPFMVGLYFNEAGLSKYAIKYTEMHPDGDINIKEKATTRRLEAGLLIGFCPEVNWLLQPYIQGRVGMASFISSTVLKDTDSNEQFDRIHALTTNVNAYGLDFGVHIVPNIWYLRGDVRIGMVANPSVKFLSLNEEEIDNVMYPIDAFEAHVSSARWFKVSVGVSYLF